MFLLALWFSSTILVIASAAHWLPIDIEIAVLPLICTAIIICGMQMYEDPCFRVPFWATPMRLRSLSEIEDPPPVPKYLYAREALIITFSFWAIVLWSISYTVAASIFSGLAVVLLVLLIGISISEPGSSSSSEPPITNGLDSSTEV